MENLLNAEQVAEILGVCRETARKLMMQMPHVDVSLSPAVKHIRVEPSALRAWMARKQMDAVQTVERKTRKRKPIQSVPYMDEYGRPYIKKNGKLVPMATPPKGVKIG